MKLSSLFRFFLILITLIQLFSLLAEHFLVDRYDREASRELALKQIQLVYEHQEDSLRGQLLVGNFKHAKMELEHYSKNSDLRVILVGPNERLPVVSGDSFKIAYKDFIITSYGKQLARIRIEKDIPSMFERVKFITLFFLFGKLLLVTSAFSLIYFSIKRWILHPIQEIASNLTSDSSGTDLRFKPLEILVLESKLRGTLELQKENIKNIEITNLARQVAHDIRSPLELLKGINSDLSFLPEDTKKRIQISINRIEEISQNLLRKQRNSEGKFDDIQSQELVSLIKSIMIEKKIEFNLLTKIEFLINVSDKPFGLFSKIDINSLKSIISNLINNSVEALEGSCGRISISAYRKNNSNIIEICDNGLGISQEVSDKIFRKGFTTKDTGNGIGLYNARQDLKEIGGTIYFETIIGMGTKFFISLPVSHLAESFVSSLDLTPYEKIIILDDDVSFHEVWREVLLDAKQMVEYYSSVDFFLSKYKNLTPSTLLLTDLDLLSIRFDGIDIICILNHHAHSILTTARADDLFLQRRCSDNKIKLLSKSFARCVEIKTVINKKSSQVVLIDDDRLIHFNWRKYCELKGLSFFSFFSIDDFLSSSSSFDFATNIYVDSNLGNGIRGEKESELIFNLGFSNLFLATGYDKESILKPRWIKDINSKSPDQLAVFIS